MKVAEWHLDSNNGLTTLTYKNLISNINFVCGQIPDEELDLTALFAFMASEGACAFDEVYQNHELIGIFPEKDVSC